MKFSIAESTLVGCFGACAVSTALVLAAWTQLGGWTVDANHPWADVLFVSAAAVQAAAILVGLTVVLPRVRRIRRERGRLHSLTGELSQRSRLFEEAALTDPLTGLKNRRYFDEALKQFLIEFRQIRRPIGLLVLDLDHFKVINDTHGHDMGDEVLRSVGRCLAEWTREHDVVARLGGEEFAIVVPNMPEASLYLFADRIRSAIGRIVVHKGNIRLKVTASVGVALAGAQEEAEGVLKRADVMLYRAKTQGRDRVCA